jgi:hypothetical protein
MFRDGVIKCAQGTIVAHKHRHIRAQTLENARNFNGDISGGDKCLAVSEAYPAPITATRFGNVSKSKNPSLDSVHSPPGTVNSDGRPPQP